MPDTFNQTTNQICMRALRLIGAFQSGETPGTTEIADCVTALNAMTKEWDADGLHIWTQEEGCLFLQPGQAQYGLGSSSPDHAALSYTSSALATMLYAGATTALLTLPLTVGAGDNVGIVQDSGAIFWSTATSPSTGLSIGLASGLAVPASAGNLVIIYPVSQTMERPLRILGLRRRWLASGIDTPLLTISRLDYQALPNKRTIGTPNQWFYDAQLNTGVLSIWQAPQSGGQWVLPFTFIRQILDWGDLNATGDFPQEWINALTYNLALEIAPEYDVDPKRLQFLAAQAVAKKATASGWDRADESVFFGVAYEQGWAR